MSSWQSLSLDVNPHARSAFAAARDLLRGDLDGFTDGDIAHLLEAANPGMVCLYRFSLSLFFFADCSFSRPNTFILPTKPGLRILKTRSDSASHCTTHGSVWTTITVTRIGIFGC